MKNYLQFIKENRNLWRNFSDEDLQNKYEDLCEQQDEISDQLRFINSIIDERKCSRSEEISKSFPKSIFDMNQEQLDFIFEHNHRTDARHSEISVNYSGQLSGLYPSGFCEETNQFYFRIITNSCFNDNEDGFELDPHVVKSIEFVGNHLKRREDGFVHFGISFTHSDVGYRDEILYGSENDIRYVHHTERQFNSIEKMLEFLVDHD